MLLRQFKSATGANMSYLVAEGPGGTGAVVDPTGDLSRLMNVIEAEGIRVSYILITHAHPDHTSGIGVITKETGARVAAHRLASIRKDLPLDDGGQIDVGALRVRILHTPGHSRDSVCYLAGNKLFTGDTLFVGECGRTDMPGGDSGALYDSLFKKLLSLPDDTEVYPGHDYGSRPTSTIGRERKTNYVLEPRTREEFIEFMAEP
ncbi:MAG: MBL fold metallo-hydrolase [Euryarchaeota archaeon]|nr:MBL fold metallo-hydrolase [Euryarchaeota archaeon]